VGLWLDFTLLGMFLFIPFAFYDGAAGLKVRCLRNLPHWETLFVLKSFLFFDSVGVWGKLTWFGMFVVTPFAFYNGAAGLKMLCSYQ